MSNGSAAGNSRRVGKEGQWVMLVPGGREAGEGDEARDGSC